MCKLKVRRATSTTHRDDRDIRWFGACYKIDILSLALLQGTSKILHRLWPSRGLWNCRSKIDTCTPCTCEKYSSEVRCGGDRTRGYARRYAEMPAFGVSGNFRYRHSWNFPESTYNDNESIGGFGPKVTFVRSLLVTLRTNSFQHIIREGIFSFLHHRIADF